MSSTRLGFFLDLSRADKATRRFAAADPEELAYLRFFLLPESPERDALLERILRGDPGELGTLSGRVLWCHGNHEDFEELAKLVGSARLAAVDRFQVLEWLRSGSIEELAGIRIGAVGGGPERPDDRPRSGDRGVCRTVTEESCDALRHEALDVLITHCGPTAVAGLEGSGSELLSGLLHSSSAIYHFYSHHERPQPPATVGTTQSIWLADVNFGHSSRRGPPRDRVHPGCMGILEWSSWE